MDPNTQNNLAQPQPQVPPVGGGQLVATPQVGATVPEETGAFGSSAGGVSAPEPHSPTANALPTKEPSPTSTQASLLLSEIRDDMIIMKDGSFRAVVACKSINFDLMSTTEREGIEYSYQNFLNSLYFTTQILIRSQRVDIGPYLDRLAEIRNSQDNMLLNILMDDYIDFIDALSQKTNIMDKSFFIVVPHYPTEDMEKTLNKSKSFFKSFFGAASTEVTKIDKVTYSKAIEEVDNRVSSVVDGLYQIGVSSVRLRTKELGELFYNFNNPDTAVREPLGDFSSTTALYVAKGDGEAPRPHLNRGEM
ncbi:hypothetical protein FWD07_03255 [Candidatus Saccharibacteria bacterium]|nr:hypothetical protein [Candidatus Saccharibacteria bacterium]